MKYILAYDFGTSSVKSAIFQEDGVLVKDCTTSYPTSYPSPGWVEQDPEDWWKAFCQSNKFLTQGIDLNDVLCVAFDGITSASVCCDKDRKPLCKAMLWQDTRAIAEGQEIASMLTPELAEGRGFMGPGRHGVQLYWIKKNHPELYAQAEHFIPNNSSYILFRLTGKSVCDRAVARSGALLAADKKDWCYELVDLMGISHSLLPQLREETDIIGEVPAELAQECGLAAGTKLIMGTGDGESVTLGAGLIHNGDVFLACGTSGGVSILGYNKNFPGTSASGAALEWLRRTFCQEEERIAAETGQDVFALISEKAAQSPVGSNGVVFCPYLAGERGSRRNPKARGAFVGLGLMTAREDVMRSVLEGIALNMNDHVMRYRADGQVVTRIVAVGGMTKSPLVRQIFADVMDAEIVTIQHSSLAGTVGGAMLAGVAMGLYKDVSEAAEKFVHIDTLTQPIPENCEKYKPLIPLFEDVYQSQVPLYEKF